MQLYTHILLCSTIFSESIFDHAEGGDCYQSPEPYEDQLEFPESLSAGDGDYDPCSSDYGDDYKSDKDNDEDNEDSIYDHNASATPPPNGWEHAHSNSMNADNSDEYKRARKVVKSKGRLKASDYVDDIQDVLNTIITYYKVNLLHFGPYPDCTHELAWAKMSWDTANRVCDLKIAHNSELIKMVSSLTTLFCLHSYSTQITCHGSHLCGEIKMKIKPLVASMYGFAVPTKETICTCNWKLVKELKEEYSFLYKVCST